jgi:PBP1b-binding outer membrane lipoprotein LpoB
MSTLSNALKGLVLAGSLLAASATPAGDVTSDRQQLSLQRHQDPSDRKGQATPVENDALRSASAQRCACASAKDPHGAIDHQR